VGSARTALFNWFIAQQEPASTFILRIEDTDTERNREEWIDGIVEAMDWLGLGPYEGPFRQSAHATAHAAAAAALRERGDAYYCDCSREDLEARKGSDPTPGYDGYCRNRLVPRSATTATRFRTPDDGTTVVHDEIRGDVTFANAVIDDFVIAKSSGAVLYALANVVDDRADRVTHVIRGEEHLPNTPKQILLWRALDEVSGDRLPLPLYAHLPLLVNEQRKKLSKRRDPVAVESFRDQGYLSAAFVNYLALLGWSPRGEEEKVSLSTCVSQFQLADVSNSPAFFDVKKLTHMNGEYIRDLDTAAFREACGPWITPWLSSWAPTNRLPPWSPQQFDEARFLALAPAVQERVALLGDVPDMMDFLFLETPRFDEAAFHKTVRQSVESQELLRRALELFASVSWHSETLHDAVLDMGAALGMVLRKAQAPIRCAVTGRLVGPPLFESLEVLGRDITRDRLAAALEMCAT